MAKNENVDLIRSAYAAYARGDLSSMLELIDPGDPRDDHNLIS